MKLIFCQNCLTLTALRRSDTFVRCACGQSKGRYLEDGLHAIVRGDPVVIGINSNDLLRAVREHPHPILIEAWVIPVDSERVERKP
jgi:hypothetical protein